MIGYYPKRAVTFIDNHDTGALSYIILLQLATASARHSVKGLLNATGYKKHQRAEQVPALVFWEFRHTGVLKRALGRPCAIEPAKHCRTKGLSLHDLQLILHI